jgi:hypothetical protein
LETEFVKDLKTTVEMHSQTLNESYKTTYKTFRAADIWKLGYIRMIRVDKCRYAKRLAVTTHLSISLPNSLSGPTPRPIEHDIKHYIRMRAAIGERSPVQV